MTEADFETIERALSIELPAQYRRRLCPFPVAWKADNADSEVWDDAPAVIGLNHGLRAGSQGWPPWLFAIGQSEGDPCGYAIDTREPDCPVWWLERMAPGPSSGPVGEPLAVWVARWAAESEPERRGDRSLMRLTAGWLAASALGLVGFWICLSRLVGRQSRKR